MTTFALLTALLLVGALVALVRELRRDPAHDAPCSHLDEFAPRWSDAGPGRWSV